MDFEAIDAGFASPYDLENHEKSSWVDDRASAALEEHLGDPDCPDRPFSFARSLDDDEREAFPAGAVDTLNAWALAEYLIPEGLGGRFRSVVELLALMRTIARRDLTVAISFGANLLAALPVWIEGTPEQQQLVAGHLRAGEFLAFALTERGHGSDLLANGLRAVRGESGYQLSGEKWLIFNARRSTAMVVFARTRRAGDPRGFSLFLLDKAALDPATWAVSAKVPTLGLRGGDVSGVRFRSCRIPDAMLLGRPGQGYETLQLTLAVTRTLCGGLSLGAADTALRTVVDFAIQRRLYGQPVFAIPHARSVLVGAFLDLLACDCVTQSAARALHRPGESVAFWSALVKFFVPTVLEQVVRDLSVVLGARFYLRGELPYGIFQKILRDLSIVSVFEGNTVINLGILASQLARRPSISSDPDRQRDRIHALYALDSPCPTFDPRAIRLRPLGADPALAGLPSRDVLSRELQGCRPVTIAEDRDTILDAVDRLRVRSRRWERRFAPHCQGFDSRPHSVTAEMIEHVQHYCRLHAAAACLQTWRENRSALGPFFESGDWLIMCLERLLAEESVPTPSSNRRLENVARELIERHRNHGRFSVLPQRLPHDTHGRHPTGTLGSD